MRFLKDRKVSGVSMMCFKTEQTNKEIVTPNL